MLERFSLGLFTELNDPPGIVDLYQPEFGCFVRARGCQRKRQVRSGLVMPGYELAVVHPVKMITREHQDRIAFVIIQMVQALPYSVGGTLKPVGPFRCDLGGENLNEPVCESTEAICSSDVTIERSRVVLSQYEDSMNIGVDAVGNRDVDQAVLAAKRYGGFGSLTRQRV